MVSDGRVAPVRRIRPVQAPEIVPIRRRRSSPGPVWGGGAVPAQSSSSDQQTLPCDHQVRRARRQAPAGGNFKTRFATTSANPPLLATAGPRENRLVSRWWGFLDHARRRSRKRVNGGQFQLPTGCSTCLVLERRKGLLFVEGVSSLHAVLRPWTCCRRKRRGDENGAERREARIASILSPRNCGA